MPLLEDLPADVQEADDKLVILRGRIDVLDPAVGNKKRMCMLQQYQALANFRKISQTLLEVEQQEQSDA